MTSPTPLPTPGADAIQRGANELAALASGSVPIVTVLGLLTPVLAAALVLTWHGLRGTDPGPAAQHLLGLVELVLLRRKRRPAPANCRRRSRARHSVSVRARRGAS